MSLTSSWPDVPGPRVLMLVANDLTIDTRVRKSASSVARAGFSVITVGIDQAGTAPEREDLDGALLTRVIPETDPRLSPHLFRYSRPELTDSLRYRADVRKKRLHNSRRSLSADMAWLIAQPPPWTQNAGMAVAAAARRLAIPDAFASKLGRMLTRYARGAWKSIRLGPRKLATISSQLIHQVSVYGIRFLAQPSRPILRKVSWRRDLPELHRFEDVLGPLIDDLQPDLIHVHDVFLLGVAARAASRAVSAGRPTRLVYDAHEYVPGLPIDQRRRDALATLEDEYYMRADAIITVSEGLATLLESRFPGQRPHVVLNAPDMDRTTKVESLRDVTGIADDVPLVVYVGGVAPHRGAEVLIDAMRSLDSDVHLVFVSNSTTGYVADLLRMGAERGLGGRLHIAPYVAPESVVSYIESATVSAVPLSRDYVNYEIALPNKLFQSIHAGVPVAVSDNPEMERFVTRHGVGEIFEGGDAQSLGKALRKIIDAPDNYADALSAPALLESISWRSQAERIVDTYASVGVLAP